MAVDSSTNRQVNTSSLLRLMERTPAGPAAPGTDQDKFYFKHHGYLSFSWIVKISELLYPTEELFAEHARY